MPPVLLLCSTLKCCRVAVASCRAGDKGAFSESLGWAVSSPGGHELALQAQQGAMSSAMKSDGDRLQGEW